MRRHLVFVFLLVGCSLLAQSTPGTFSAADVVAHWRAAVHAYKASRYADVKTISTEDGIPGSIEEWIAPDAYRRSVRRHFDNSEWLLAHVRERKDWNGWVRNIEGKEMERLQSAIAETQAVLFGPSNELETAEVSRTSDGNSYILRYKPQGGLETSWYIDAKTFLPIRSVRPGEDTEISTTYSAWKVVNGVLTPFHGVVAETDKPEFIWDRERIEYGPTPSRETFARLVPGASDTILSSTAKPIPFTLEANHIVFDISINGYPPMPWILDTGADQNVVNSARAKEFGIREYARTTTTGGGNSAEYGYAAGATLARPGIEIRNQHVATIDQSGLEQALGVKFGGILGYDFISRFVMEIDYEKHIITLHDPKTWSYSGHGFIVPVVFDNGIPHASGSIAVPTKANIPAYFVVDFGASETATLTSSFVKANDLARLAQTNINVNRPAGLEKQFFAQNNVRGHLDRLTIGNLTVTDVPVNMSVNTTGAYASANFSGTVGESIYSRYHVYLDYARNRIILEPTPESDKPFPPRETYGLTLLASGTDLHTYTVAAVRAGSPAEKDGLKKGDIIAAVDGNPSTQFSLRELRDWLSHADHHHIFEITRGTKHVSIDAQIRLVSIER